MAGKLMMWGFGWQLGGPDSDTIFGMAYGPNRQAINDARFDLGAFNTLYEQQRVLPDGPERLDKLHQATRLLAAYMPYMMHLHRVQSDLAQAVGDRVSPPSVHTLASGAGWNIDESRRKKNMTLATFLRLGLVVQPGCRLGRRAVAVAAKPPMAGAAIAILLPLLGTASCWRSIRHRRIG